MGLNTVIVIRNDSLHQIREDAEYFVDQLCNIASSGSIHRKDNIPGGKVISIEHVSYVQIIAIGDGIGKALGGVSDSSPSDPDMPEKALRALAAKLGFTVTKKRRTKAK